MPRSRGRDRYRGGKRVPRPTPLERLVAEQRRMIEAEQKIGPPPIGRAARGTEPPVAYAIPSWCVRGARVDYHAIIGADPTLYNVAVTADPFVVKGVGYVTFIEKIRGWVAVDALSLAGKDS